LNDIAVRWSILPMDLVAWATQGLLRLSAALPPIRTVSSRTLSDIVEIAGSDVIPLFRLNGARLDSVAITRLRAQRETEWEWIAEPAEGITITATEVLVTRVEVERFEREHELYGGPASRDMKGAHLERSRGAGPGAPPRYDWDRFFVAIARRIHDQGIPSSQGELVREMLDWFQEKDGNQAPDESTVRRKVAMVWRELNRPA
jgi:hypothetical protein